MRISDWSSDVCSSDLSPEYTAADHAAGASVGATLVQLLPGLTRLDYRDVTRLDCPIFLVAGRRAFQTPAQIAAAWFAKLRAPANRPLDRKTVGSGKSGSVRLVLGGSSIIKKKT